MARPTTPEAVTPVPRAPITPIRTGNRALSPPSKSPIATPPPPSPIPYLPWRDQISWDHLLHSAPIVDNFDDESDIETLAPQTPPNKILLSKERQAILHQRLQAGHGTHRVHYIVYDDYVADIHGNEIPDSHLILVTGDPRLNGGILSFDGVDVEERMVVEKRYGFWGVYEVDWDEEEEEEGEIPVEQQIYQVFLDGAGGDHEEAWDVYQRFRAHKERQTRKERVYQVILKELEGNEALAREVHARWCEEEEQRENSEDEQEEERDDDNEHDVFARATMWAKGFRRGYEMRDASLQKSPTKSVSSSDVQLRDSSLLHKSPIKPVLSSDVQDDMAQSSESKQEPGVYDCLSEWAVLLNGEDTPRETASDSMCEGTDSLIDTSIEQNQDVYDCLDEWARSLEQDTKHASFYNEASKFADNRAHGKLIDIATKTPDVYEYLGLIFLDGNSPFKERLPKTPEDFLHHGRHSLTSFWKVNADRLSDRSLEANCICGNGWKDGQMM
ncbi:hypothetical protein GE21DRAFT_1352308 [Neurospora crassa]|nr:hypothetical protein GE21DRAFT_1352308 [Neurospora crassa]